VSATESCFCTTFEFGLTCGIETHHSFRQRASRIKIDGKGKLILYGEADTVWERLTLSEVDHEGTRSSENRQSVSNCEQINC
jgi:hypothetical protein